MTAFQQTDSGTSQLNPISDVREGILARISGGLVGNFSVGFILANWRLIPMATGSLSVNERIQMISNYLNTDACHIYGGILFGFLLILFQFLSAIVIDILHIWIGNIKFYFRLHWDLSNDKYAKHLRTIMKYQHIKIIQVMENLNKSQLTNDPDIIKNNNILHAVKTSLLNYSTDKFMLAVPGVATSLSEEVDIHFNNNP